MIRSFNRLVSVDLGFEPGSFLTLQATPAELKAPVFTNYYTGLVDAIRQMPDVEAAARSITCRSWEARRSPRSRPMPEGQARSRSTGAAGLFRGDWPSARKGRFPAHEDLASGRDVVGAHRAIGSRALSGQFRPSAGHTNEQGVAESEVVGIAPELTVDGRRADCGRDTTRCSACTARAEDRPDSLVVVVRPRANASGLPSG